MAIDIPYFGRWYPSINPVARYFPCFPATILTSLNSIIVANPRQKTAVRDETWFFYPLNARMA